MEVVESVREVTLEGTKTPFGAGAAAVVGGGKGSVVGATVGAVLGGLGGAAAEEAVTKQKGLEITVRLDSGRLIAVTQATTDEDFRPRDRVLSGGGTTRVTR